MHYVYIITNLANNKIYIGQTNNPSLRWSQHRSNVKYNINKMLVTRAMIKYGLNLFDFKIIATALTQESIDALEMLLINQYDSCNRTKGYNIAPGGNKLIHTDEIKSKISKTLKERYKTQSGWAKGKKLSEEHKIALSKASMGKAGTNNGKKFSKEHKEKISKSLLGKKLSEEHIKKLSESHMGHIAPNRKLTFEIAEQIRLEYKINNITQKQLGKKYNLSQNCIFGILKNKTYVTKEIYE